LNWIRKVSGLLAPVYLLQQDQMSAESILTAALECDAPMQTVGQRLVWAARADLALARSDPGMALDITERLIARASNLSDEYVIPRLWKLRGEALTVLGRVAEGEAVLRAAQEATHAQRLRPWLWRICVSLGKLYKAQGRMEEAEQTLASALAIIEELAAGVPEEHLRAHFLSQATTMLPQKRSLTPESAARQTYGGLTVREREVAVLVAQGKTNREIADTLVVSHRTVETHVSTILSKLGVPSRSRIAVWAVEVGLVKNGA
jgi:DNA-binding CsgD family transcriptional regulator